MFARIRERLRPKEAEEEPCAVLGYLDSATHEGCSGWACLLGDPGATLKVEVLVDGHPIARAVANAWRPDVKAAGIGTGATGSGLCSRDLCPGSGRTWSPRVPWTRAS